MRYLLVILLVTALAWAQPGPPRPGPAGPGPRTTTSAGPTSPIPFVVGTLSFVSSSRLTVNPDATAGVGAQMDFKTDATTFQSPKLSSGDRVVIAYAGDKATAVLRCPKGSDPQELLKSVPKRK